MGCEKMREWLMTDYLDNELDPRRSAEVEGHLKVCFACLEFSKAVRKAAVAPFKDSKPLQPEPAVWQGIREKILAGERDSKDWFGKAAAFLEPFLRIPRPVYGTVFAAALIVAVIAITRWPSHYTDPAYGYIAEQMTFLGQLQAGDPELFNGDFQDYEAIWEAA